MTQKTIAQKTIRVDSAKPEKAAYPTNGAVSTEINAPLHTNGDHDPQDEYLWDCAIANSMDVIRELADKALADRQAGRTKKITI